MSAILDKLAKAKSENVSKPIANRRVWRRAFLRALAENGSAVESAKLAGVNYQYAKRCKSNEPRFARRWDRALDTADRTTVETIISAVKRRAVHGDTRTIVIKGQAIEVRDKASDKAAFGLLEALDPRFRTRREGGTVVNLSIVNDHSRALIASDPQMLLLQCEMDARIARATSPQVALIAPPQDR